MSVSVDDVVDWEDSPKAHLPGTGAVKVFVAIELLKLSEINAVRSTADVQLDVSLFWKDPRIAKLNRESIAAAAAAATAAAASSEPAAAVVGMRRRSSARHRHMSVGSGDDGSLRDNDVPDKLWRPSFDLQQRCSDISQDTFANPDAATSEVEIVDAASGQLQLTISIAGTIDNPMDVREVKAAAAAAAAAVAAASSAAAVACCDPPPTSPPSRLLRSSHRSPPAPTTLAVSL